MKQLVFDAITEALRKMNVKANIEVSNSTGHGDLSSNIIFKLTKELKLSPEVIGKQLINNINCDKFSIKKVEFARPGFLNFYLNYDEKNRIINEILEKKDSFGKGSSSKYVNIEYVSANPTGYLHIGHARGAAYGDSLARILSFSGMKVDTEYYINDAGMQIEDLGKTTFLRYQELHGVKIDVNNLTYSGTEIIDAAKIIKNKIKDKYKNKKLTPEILKYFCDEAKAILLDIIKKHLALFNVKMKKYFSEESLYKDNLILSKINEIPKKYLLKKDGALWLKTTEFGDDKDRVLIKSDGKYTYFSPDVVYHNIKAERGYDLLINVFGADHSGYVKRIETSLDIKGYHNKLKVPIVQMVRLIRDGKEVVMSKRKGTSYTLIQLINEVGTDAARFALLSRTLNSKMDFDVAAATKNTNDNPVIYVQYAHARACQLLKKVRYRQPNVIKFHHDSLKTTKEQLILDELWKFPELIKIMSENLKVNLLTTYILNLSKLFHSFYNNVQVIKATDEQEKLLLIASIAQVIKTGLNLLGVNAPNKMNYNQQ